MTPRTQHEMLTEFADDLRARFRSPTSDHFDNIEDTEALEWFEAANAAGDMWTDHVCGAISRADDKLLHRFDGLIGRTLGTVTLDQARDFLDVLRAMLIDEARRQVQQRMEREALLWTPTKEEP